MKPLKIMRSNPLSELLTRPANLSISFSMRRSLIFSLYKRSGSFYSEYWVAGIQPASAGESSYDIFVRWQPRVKQPIGWDPDLNDGVRLNIRPLFTMPDVGKKGAGVLRDKPNINWNKDRGKDVESALWYHLWGGDRINDHHLTLADKRSARDQKESSS